MASERPGPHCGPGPYGIGSDTWPGLSQLAADAAQIARHVGAIIGDDTRQDTDGLRASLQEELGDLRAAIEYVIGKNDLDWDAVNRRRDRKRSLYERAHAGKAPAHAGEDPAHAGEDPAHAGKNSASAAMSRAR